MLLVLFALTLASSMGGAEAIISAESIGNWFTNAIKNFFLWIWDGILGAINPTSQAITDWATELARDVFHSLSSATSVFQENANKTISKLLNLDKGHEELPPVMRFLISIMEAGPLPPESYVGKANPVEEVNHLRYWIWIIKWGLITYIAISIILIAWFGIINYRNKRLEARITGKSPSKKAKVEGNPPTIKMQD